VNKKAQASASSASTLLIIIALVIVLYILFLPPESREELLQNNDSSVGGTSAQENINSLISENVGSLSYFPTTLEQHSIGNIYLFETTNAEILETINPFIIQNGWFNKKFKTISFKVQDIDNTEDTMLSITASKTKGILTIYLNEELIYESQFETITPAPITLKKALLKEENSLRFEVGGVGFAFWKTNEYQFKSMQIIGDVTDLSGQEGQNTFIITNTEFLNIEDVKLSFVPYCNNIQEVGKLTIQINKNIVFSAIPMCDDPYKQSFSPAILNSGTNEIKFTTAKGSYSIEQISVVTDLKETKSAIYYFDLNQSQYDQVADNEKDITLTLKFVDNQENKKATLNVNGHFTEIDQVDPEYSRLIDNWVEPGNNYVEIKPKVDIHIVELKVELE
jgi:hypothetical protein